MCANIFCWVRQSWRSTQVIESGDTKLHFFFTVQFDTKHEGVFIKLQLTLVISTSLISNNRLSRSENLVPA